MTIYALSSGPGISGVSVIRVSGNQARNIVSKLTNGDFPSPRKATLKKINKINTNELIDAVSYTHLTLPTICSV